MNNRGFTLAEILIVVAIIIILMMMVLVNLQNQINKSYDSERKSDLHKIRKAFNEYFNDFGCYPALTILDNCGSTGTSNDNPPGLAPYLPKIPCDPRTHQPYLYKPVDATNICAGYKILAGLFDLADPAITQIGCSPTSGCGYGSLYNWGLSEGGVVPTGQLVPTPTSTPYLSPTPGNYACSPGGFCKVYSNPQDAGCPVTYSDRLCSGQCVYPTNWCQY